MKLNYFPAVNYFTLQHSNSDNASQGMQIATYNEAPTHLEVEEAVNSDEEVEILNLVVSTPHIKLRVSDRVFFKYMGHVTIKDIAKSNISFADRNEISFETRYQVTRNIVDADGYSLTGQTFRLVFSSVNAGNTMKRFVQSLGLKP